MGSSPQIVIKNERLFSAAKMARLKNTSSLLTRKLADCMCAIAYQYNSLQKLMFLRLLHFKEGIEKNKVYFTLTA